jgi:SAM-dependent methyltransferase
MTDKYLEKIYQHMGQNLVVDDSYFEIDSRFYNIEVFLRALPPGKLLDMGCGQGSVLHRLRDYHDVYGLEFDEGARTIALQRGLRCEPIDLNNAEDIPYDQCFDYILISEVCEHLLDPRNAFKVAFKRIKKGGVFLVTVPNSIPLFVRANLILGRTNPWIHYPSQDTEITGHIRFYTFASLKALAEQEGFQLISSRGVSWRFNGKIWGRIFYWLARATGGSSSINRRMMLFDDAMSKLLPTLSPGIFMAFRKP